MNREAGPQQTGENAPHILTLDFWNSEKRISVVYKPLVYGILLQEPKDEGIHHKFFIYMHEFIFNGINAVFNIFDLIFPLICHEYLYIFIQTCMHIITLLF